MGLNAVLYGVGGMVCLSLAIAFATVLLRDVGIEYERWESFVLLVTAHVAAMTASAGGSSILIVEAMKQDATVATVTVLVYSLGALPVLTRHPRLLREWCPSQ